jgi:hypothetical protein
MTDDTRPRITCPGCGGDYLPTKRGKLRAHVGVFGLPCAWSKRPPNPNDNMARRRIKRACEQLTAGIVQMETELAAAKRQLAKMQEITTT